MSTTLTFEKVAIAPLSDVSDVLFVAQSTENPSARVDGTVEVYAGGRRRVVKTEGEDLSVPFTFSRVTRAEYEGLLALVGEPVVVRDQRSRVIYGVFFVLDGSEVAVRDNFVFDVSFTLEQITYSEIV